jgi:hypothetical protein
MDKRIAAIEQEPDGWWVYLKPGFIHVDGTHQLAADTKREALRGMANVEPCDCDECKQLAAEGKW